MRWSPTKKATSGSAGAGNGNNTDAQPNDTSEDETTDGEGGDCSGFTFKTWALEKSDWANGKQK